MLWCAISLCALIPVGCQLCAPLHPFLASEDLDLRLTTIDGIDFGETSMFAEGVGEEPPEPPLSSPTDRDGLEEVPAPEPSPAPTRIELRLEDARAAALANNLELRIELLNPRIAETSVSEEMSRFESTFAATVAQDRDDPPPGFRFGGPPDIATGTVGAAITQPLQTGGEVRFDHQTFRTNPVITGLPTTWTSAMGVSATQPLLRNAGFQVNTAPIQVAAARSGISGARAKLTAINVLADVERAYWQLYGARLELDVQLEQVRIAEQVLGDTLRRIELNAIPATQTPKAERLRAESGLAQRRDFLIAAETEVRLAARALKRIMQRVDLPVDGPTEIVPLTPPDPLELRLERKGLTMSAVENRMEMLELQLQLLINEFDIGVARNATLPRLDFRVDYTSIGFEPTLGTALDDSLDGKFSDRLLMFALEIPLSGNIAAQSQLRRAQLQRAQTLLTRDRLGVIIRQEVNDAADRFEQNWRRIVATRAATEATIATYEAEETVHINGRITATQLLEAALNIAVAQSQEIRATVDYQISKVDLAVAAGAMLGYGSIHWTSHSVEGH